MEAIDYKLCSCSAYEIFDDIERRCVLNSMPIECHPTEFNSINSVIHLSIIFIGLRLGAKTFMNYAYVYKMCIG